MRLKTLWCSIRGEMEVSGWLVGWYVRVGATMGAMTESRGEVGVWWDCGVAVGRGGLACLDSGHKSRIPVSFHVRYTNDVYDLDRAFKLLLLSDYFI